MLIELNCLLCNSIKEKPLITDPILTNINIIPILFYKYLYKYKHKFFKYYNHFIRLKMVKDGQLSNGHGKKQFKKQCTVLKGQTEQEVKVFNRLFKKRKEKQRIINNNLSLFHKISFSIFI